MTQEKSKLYGIIYKVTNIINSKIYIGQTKRTLEKRRYFHLYESKHTRLDFHFYRAIKKYGQENFLWETIDKAFSREELLDKEIYWIKFYNSSHIDSGYNMTNGGEGFGSPTDQVKKSMGRNMVLEKNPFYGKVHTENSRYLMAVANSNRKHNPHSDITKQKIRDAHLSHKNKKRPIVCIETQQLFESIKLAADTIKVSSAAILYACKNDKGTCGGFHWKYYEDTID